MGGNWLCLGWLHYSKRWSSLLLCFYKQSCSSVIHNPDCCIHGFKPRQVQRKEAGDKIIQGMGKYCRKKGEEATKKPQPQHFWVAACFWSLHQFDSKTYPSEFMGGKGGKVVLLTLRLLLNIKTGGINFLTPPLIFDVMYFRGASPLRICSQKWNMWLWEYSSSFLSPIRC